MRILSNKVIIISFLVLIICNYESKAQFEVNAQYRSRPEFRDGYQKLAFEGSTPAFLISQRARLTFVYENELLKLKFTPQDVRIWGDEQLVSSTGVYGDYASLDLLEGFVEIKPYKNVLISVGRQQLIYDNERLLAARNWNQNGLAYDAVVMKFRIKNWNLDLGSSWNTMSDALSDNIYPATRIKSLNFIWLNRKIKENLLFSLMNIASGVTETDTTNKLNFRYTTGLYANYKWDNLKIWGDFYYQTGRSQAGNRVCAVLFDLDAGYKINNVIAGTGMSYLSGNKKTGADMTADHLFDILYGARHKYFGFMDYFRNFPSNTRQGGLTDYYCYLDFRFFKKISILNTAHYFRLAKTNSTTPHNNNLGYENDLIVKYGFSEWGSLESGYMFFLPTNSLKSVQNVQNNKFSQFFYLQLTVKQTLFKYLNPEPKL